MIIYEKKVTVAKLDKNEVETAIVDFVKHNGPYPGAALKVDYVSDSAGKYLGAHVTWEETLAQIERETK
jgi:hypothetical protein